MTRYVITKAVNGYYCHSHTPGFYRSYGSWGLTPREAYLHEHWKNRITSGSDEQIMRRYPLPGFRCTLPKHMR